MLALAAVAVAIALITTSTLGHGSASTAAAPMPTLKVTLHHVRPGDSLETIAARYHSTVAILEQLNPRLNPQALIPGSVLRVGTTSS
jgi:LysM repeat protein